MIAKNTVQNINLAISTNLYVGFASCAVFHATSWRQSCAGWISDGSTWGCALSSGAKNWFRSLRATNRSSLSLYYIANSSIRSIFKSVYLWTVSVCSQISWLRNIQIKVLSSSYNSIKTEANNSHKTRHKYNLFHSLTLLLSNPLVN
jgi:hypothetical protein